MSGSCQYCGAAAPVEVLDIYVEDHAYMLDFCCEGMQAEYYWDPQLAVPELKDHCNMRRLVGHQLDFKLEITTIPQAEAKAFIEAHHRHNKAPVGWKYGFSAYNGTTLIAVATAGRPVARAYNNKGIIEVNRLCVHPDVPSWLVYNACSKLYAACTKEAKRRGYKKIITYTRADEKGTSLRASNFKPEAHIKGRVYKRNGVVRSHLTPIDKTRWSIIIH